MNDRTTRERWHVSKAVPVTLIVGLLANTMLGVWMARGLVADLHETRRDVADTTRRVTALESIRSTERVSERLAVVESQVTDTKAAILRVEANVQKLVERRP